MSTKTYIYGLFTSRDTEPLEVIELKVEDDDLARKTFEVLVPEFRVSSLIVDLIQEIEE